MIYNNKYNKNLFSEKRIASLLMLQNHHRRKEHDFYGKQIDNKPVVQSEMGPIDENAFMSYGRKNLLFYQFRFFNLKAQINILNTIDQQIQILSFKLEDKQEIALLADMRDLILSLKESRYCNIIENADKVIEYVSKILKNKGVNSEIEKISSLLLSSAITIIRTFNFYYGKDTDESNTYTSNVASNYTEDNTVICRVCEEVIELDKFEQHMMYCLKAYNSGTKLTKTDKQIEAQIDYIKKCYLSEIVLGNEELAVRVNIPMFHLTFILMEALKIDPKIYDSSEVFKNMRLKNLYQVINSKHHGVLANSEKLIREKSKIVNAIRETAGVLSSTRVSGNSMPAGKKKILVSDFTFIKRISSGAFASVFVVKKNSTGDIYAIKAIPRKSIQHKNTSKRLNAEKDILRSFNNPYLISFYYSIIGNRNYYIVTEYVPGGDLFSLLQNVGSFDEETTKVYVIQILEALKYLRERGIIHRDLKPDNILICENGSIKLIDFGVSFQGCVDRSFTEHQNQPDSEVVGTPDYMAPEIILARRHDFSSDYWSLGVIVYEFLYGVPPFHSETEQGTITNIIKGKVTFSPDFEISNEAKDFILRLLTHKREDRMGYNDISEIFNHKWLDGITHDKVKPPFVPDLESRTDTQYFEQRYEFQTVSDKDIIADIIDSEQQRPSELKDLVEFETTSIQNLADQSKQDAAQKITRRSPSVMQSLSNLLIKE